MDKKLMLDADTPNVNPDPYGVRLSRPPVHEPRGRDEVLMFFARHPLLYWTLALVYWAFLFRWLAS